MRERAQLYLDDPALVRNIIADGCEKARKLAARNHARCARGDGAELRLKPWKPSCNRRSPARTAARSKEETMPTDACQFFYECTGCHTVLRPKPGDCCVFCSFGTMPCPPIQLQQDCCDH